MPFAGLFVGKCCDDLLLVVADNGSMETTSARARCSRIRRQWEDSSRLIPAFASFLYTAGQSLRQTPEPRNRSRVTTRSNGVAAGTVSIFRSSGNQIFGVGLGQSLLTAYCSMPANL